MRKSLLLFAGSLMLALQLFAQSRTITGKVTDEKGQPVPNASVVVKGTSIGTTSQTDGTYSISVPASARTLVISAVGLTTREFAIGSNTVINATLNTENKSLEEVVVVAYGTQKKADLTGSVTQLKTKDVENVPFTSVDKILQGKVPGLQSVASSGAPGSGQTLILRGIGSINASSQPLYVVDGVPINSGDLTRVSPVGNALANMNPNDIESISVLKDASAASIYGSRAANGVILITTKRGHSGKTRIRFDAELGNSDIAYKNSDALPLSTPEYRELTVEGAVNAGLNQSDAEAFVDANFGTALGVNTNWLDEVTRKGSQDQYTLSLDGGNDRTTFYLSGALFRQQGVVIQSDFKRYNVSATVRHKVLDNLTVTLRIPTSLNTTNAPYSGGYFRNPVLSSFFLLPTQKPYNDDGTINISRSGYPNFPSLYNPVALAILSTESAKILQVRPNIEIDYNILKGLTFTSKYGIDYNSLEENQYDSKLHGDARNVGGRAYAYYTRYFNWDFTNYLDYTRALDSKEDITASLKLGYEAQKSMTYGISAMGEGFPPTEDLKYPNVAANPKTASAYGSDYSFNSIFSFLSLKYQDKYIIDGSFRRDGSSRFGSNNRNGNFWSVGATWNIDKEDFMESVSWISQAKLRASYGVNGNGGIGNYTWRPTYGFGANYNGNNGSFPSNIGNLDLTWELNKPFNVGVDLSVFKNRVNLSVDYYKRTTSELLLNAQISRTSGFSSILSNIGSMENKGVEISLNATPLQFKDFSWVVDFNIAFNKNKVTQLYEGQDIANGSFLIREGYDFQTFYVRQWAGVDPDNGDPLWFKDSSKSVKTNVYSQADRVLFGSASPKYFGGFTNTFTYKGISVSAQFYFSAGNYLRDTWARYYMGDGFGPGFNKLKIELQRWQKPGDITNVPKYIYGGNQLSSEFSSRFLYHGDFIRLRNLQVGYNIPQTVLRHLKYVSGLNVYVRGTNLWTWVKDKNLTFDPEQGSNNLTNLEIFIPKTMTVGASVSF